MTNILPKQEIENTCIKRYQKSLISLICFASASPPRNSYPPTRSLVCGGGHVTCIMKSFDMTRRFWQTVANQHNQRIITRQGVPMASKSNITTAAFTPAWHNHRPSEVDQVQHSNAKLRVTSIHLGYLNKLYVIHAESFMHIQNQPYASMCHNTPWPIWHIIIMI